METNKELNLNIGLPSIMLIFVSLCLVSFAILTIVSSNSDLKLSKKIADRTLTYYDACNQAEEAIARINSEYLSLYNNSHSESIYYEKCKETILNYPIGDLQSLEVVVVPHFPNENDSSLYTINSWKIITNENIEYDESLNVIIDF